MDEKTHNRLIDMRDYAEKAVYFLGTMSEAEILKDERTYFACVKSIEVIGEAAAQIGRDKLDVYAGIAWADIIGMRNILIHEYSGISPQTIHQTITHFLPEFILKIEKILESSK